MKQILFFLAASFLAFQVDASLLGDDGLEHADDDKGFLRRDLGGNKPAKIEVCHLHRESQCGKTYKTLSVSPNAGDGHEGHGDYVNAGCGEEDVCSDLCRHRACYDDYIAGSDMCQCLEASYKCGPNTECDGAGDCTCLEGYEDTSGENANDPDVGCTEIEVCETKVYTKSNGLTYVGPATYSCSLQTITTCLRTYSWTHNFNNNHNQQASIKINNDFPDNYGTNNFVKSIAVSAFGAQICIAPDGAPFAPAGGLGPFLAKVNGVTVGTFEDDGKVQRTASCSCGDYRDWECDEFNYDPVELLCSATDDYEFNGENELTVDGLLYNTDGFTDPSITVTVEVCPRSTNSACS
jgi:hypothetical protein